MIKRFLIVFVTVGAFVSLWYYDASINDGLSSKFRTSAAIEAGFTFRDSEVIQPNESIVLSGEGYRARGLPPFRIVQTSFGKEEGVAVWYFTNLLINIAWVAALSALISTLWFLLARERKRRRAATQTPAQPAAEA